MAIWFTNFPLPPSVNEYLMPVVGKNPNGTFSGRLVKTQIHRNYQAICEAWVLQNREAVRKAKAELGDLKQKFELNETPFALRIDCYFVFHRERVFTVNHKCSPIDANNRLKPLLDALVLTLGIDDKHYFAGNCEKVTTDSKALECTMVKIDLMQPRTLAQIKNLIQT